MGSHRQTLTIQPPLQKTYAGRGMPICAGGRGAGHVLPAEAWQGYADLAHVLREEDDEEDHDQPQLGAGGDP